MIDFMTNNKIYEYQSTNQVAVILSQFDSNYVMDLVESQIQDQFNYFDTNPKSNNVEAYEMIFKQLYTNYPNDIDNIDDSRKEVYISIIKAICFRFNLQFNFDDDMDIYTFAKYLYDFFVSNFNNYMVNFYTRFIREQKDSLYEQLNLEEYKRNKDTSTNYSRLVFDDEKIVILSANIPTIIKYISSLSVSDDLIYRYSYGDDPDKISILADHISAPYGIFGIYTSLINNNDFMYTNIVTQVRLRLQMENMQLEKKIDKINGL